MSGQPRRNPFPSTDHSDVFAAAWTLVQSGRLAEAELLGRGLLSALPAEVAAHSCLGNLMSRLGRLPESDAILRRAVLCQPDLAEAWSNWCGPLGELGRGADCIAAARKAVTLRPDFAEAWASLAAALRRDRGDIRGSIAGYRRVGRLKPELTMALSYAAFQRREACDWGNAAEENAALLARLRNSSPVDCFSFLSAGASAADQLRAARLRAARLSASAETRFAHGERRAGRLRVGYLSADFCCHVIGMIIPEIIERHDRTAFEITGYSYGPDDRSLERRRLQAGFEHFVDLGPLSHAEAARRIHLDGIDILVDLTGYTRNERSQILAFRPAPAQVSFLGYPGTMGAEFVDYLIGDAVLLPGDAEAFFDEKIIRLPDCYMPRDTRRRPGPAPSRQACGLPEQGLVFCCFNNGYKITPELFAVWMRLLAATPGSVLWLSPGHPAAETNLRQAAGDLADRLVFAPRAAPAAYLARLSLADLYLDTYPYTAGATANDALWAALPVLTCRGDSYVGRMAASQLTAVGLPELITGSLGDYESLALALARDPGRLAGLRRRLAAGRRDSALFDMARFTRNLEAAYRRIQALRQAGEPSRALDIAPAPPRSEADLFAEAGKRYQAGDWEGTTKIVRTILALAPANVEAWSNLGVCRQKVEGPESAEAAYRRAIALNPLYLDATFNLANALQAMERPDALLAAYRQAMLFLPGDERLAFSLGIAWEGGKQTEEAIRWYERTVTLCPEHAEGWSNLGNLRKKGEKRDQAIAAYRRAVICQPGFAGAWCNLSTTFGDAERLDEAEAAGRRAVAADPLLFLAHHDLGIALKRKKRGAEAVLAYQRALILEPAHAEAWSNLGGAIEVRQHFETTITAFRRAISADPDYAEGHFNLGFGLLRAGRWEEGWRQYEWRRNPRVRSEKPRDFDQPMWDGEPCAGVVLIHAEQGLGDTLQFCRYATLAARRARVVLEVQRPIRALLSGLAGVEKVIAAGDPLPDFVAHCPLLSLPGLFGTTPETVPGAVPYITADPARVAAWAARLPAGEFRIGIVWQGSLTYKGDHFRSTPLAALAPLARLPGVRLISLQKGAGVEQMDAMPRGMAVARLGDDFDAGADAFLDAAAVISCLDLVIGVDTAILHLAGAMGRPAWLALSTYPHWCWMLDRADTAWYPSFRLFRQAAAGDWEGVFAAMARALKAGAFPAPAAEALMEKAATSFARGDIGATDAALRTVLAIRPDDAPAWSNRSICLQRSGRPDAAESANRRAIGLAPERVELHFNLGNELRDQGRFAEAAQSYATAVAVAPGWGRAYANLGNLQAEAALFDFAIASFTRALTLGGDAADINFNLGTALGQRGRGEESVAAYRKALAAKPDFAGALVQLCLQRRNLCDWPGLAEEEAAVLAKIRQGHLCGAPGCLLPMASTPSDQQKAARAWSRALAMPHRFATKARPKRGKLRLGYISADLRRHVIGQLVPELIERHDRGAFEVFGYSFGPDDGSPERRRLEKAFEHFIDLGPLSHAEAARRIHQDGIDILVDLTGYAQFARSRILACRPAPVQVSFLGFPGTMGAEFVDYVIGDAVLLPEELDAFFDEKIIRLPDCYIPSDTRRRPGPAPSRQACGLPEDGLVFCCFNNGYKLTTEMFAVWMRLLEAVPGSVLWLSPGDPAAEANLRRAAAGLAERLVFAPRAGMAEYLARLGMADLFLDTFPYTAGATANDALWAGLPVLTCRGDTYVGRMAASQLTAIGLPELITFSLAEYEALALALARDPDALAGLRRRLAAGRQSAALFDMARFTRNLETAYQEIAEEAGCRK